MGPRGEVCTDSSVHGSGQFPEGMKACVYSANYGGHDAGHPFPTESGLRAIMFTDDPGLLVPGWEMRTVSLPNLATPRVQAKFWKLRPELAVPDAEVSIWVDASMALRASISQVPDLLGNEEAVFFPHQDRDDIHDEVWASWLGRSAAYGGQPLDEQVAHYRAQGHPEHWGLVEAGFLLRRHSPAVIELGQRWWDEILRWSTQDQLSLPFVLRRMESRLRWRYWPWPMSGQSWFTIESHLRPT